MAHPDIENDLNSALKLDGSFASSVVPRWQRKALENSQVSANKSLNTSSFLNVSSSIQNSKCLSPLQNNSPSKNKNLKNAGKSPNMLKTPPAGDRFIPSRRGTDAEVRDFLMSKSVQNIENLSPNRQEIEKFKIEKICGTDVFNKRVMTFQNKAPQPPEEYDQNLKVLYTSAQSSSKKKKRFIPTCPDRILDAPEIKNDYYINLIDWSPTNLVAVCLSNHLYVWNAVSCSISQISSLEEGDHFSSVAWIGRDSFLAVGTSQYSVEIWDVARAKKMRTMQGHTSRVASLAWSSHNLSSGSGDGALHHHDVRVAQHLVEANPLAHSAGICGMHWSADGRYLATGGNDNLVNVWSSSNSQSHFQQFAEHQAAVKAVRWCPWQTSLLATGGGTADRCIRLWNVVRGVCFKTIDTGSQVSSLLWNREYKELISGHGYSKNELSIWKYPNLTKVVELQGHENRVLNLAMSPDGAYVMSAGADETLRIWHAFALDPEKKKKTTIETDNISRHFSGMVIR